MGWPVAQEEEEKGSCVVFQRVHTLYPSMSGLFSRLGGESDGKWHSPWGSYFSLHMGALEVQDSNFCRGGQALVACRECVVADFVDELLKFRGLFGCW